MAVRADELIIANRDGEPVLEVVDDQTSYLVWRVEYQAAAVSLTSPAVTLRRSDSESVTLATVAASSGEVAATVLAAEIDTTRAAIGDDLVAELTGTYTSGSDTYQVRHRSAVTVVSRATRSVVMYDEITARYPQLAKACALPAGQTTFHAQMRIGLRDYRRELHLRFGRVHDVVYPDQLAGLQVAYCIAAVAHWQRGASSGQSDYWRDEVYYWRGDPNQPGQVGEIGRLWQRLTAVVEAGARKAWGTVPDTTVQGLRAHVPGAEGPVSRGGGM